MQIYFHKVMNNFLLITKFGLLGYSFYICTINQLNHKRMTPFEQAIQDVKDGKLKTPSVSIGTKPIDYFKYQLAAHKFNLSIMASGMTCRGIKFTDIKKYYGLKGRTAKDVLPQFIELMEKHLGE